jgi:uncharacterized membrane protein YfhO
MIRFFLRLILITIIRFVLIFTLAVFVESFEVSPLPDWSLVIFVYLMLFVITYGLARWAFRGYTASKNAVIALFLCFIVVESILEAWVQLAFTRWDWSIVLNSFTWSKLIPLVTTVLALALAVIRKRKQTTPIEAI